MGLACGIEEKLIKGVGVERIFWGERMEEEAVAHCPVIGGQGEGMARMGPQKGVFDEKVMRSVSRLGNVDQRGHSTREVGQGLFKGVEVESCKGKALL